MKKRSLGLMCAFHAQMDLEGFSGFIQNHAIQDRNFSVLLIDSTLLYVLPGFKWEHYAFTVVIMHFTAGG